MECSVCFNNINHKKFKIYPSKFLLCYSDFVFNELKLILNDYEIFEKQSQASKCGSFIMNDDC